MFHAFLSAASQQSYTSQRACCLNAAASAAAAAAAAACCVDVSLMMQALRSPDGARKLPDAMKAFGLCSARKLDMLSEDHQRSFTCSAGQKPLTGQTVSSILFTEHCYHWKLSPKPIAVDRSHGCMEVLLLR
jgi:hypothetical protein